MGTMKINPRSPYGRLLLEKQEVKRLLLSGVTSMFFRGWTDRESSGNQGGGKRLMVLAWQLARPLVFRWAAGVGWRLIRNMFVQRRRG